MMTPGDVGNGNGAGAWKAATFFLAGVVMTLAAAWITVTHDSISRSELNEIVRGIYQQMGDRDKANAERATRLETQVQQIAVDTAGIAARLGVPARPAAH
jgi:hypothetical protein